MSMYELVPDADRVEGAIELTDGGFDRIVPTDLVEVVTEDDAHFAPSVEERYHV